MKTINEMHLAKTNRIFYISDEGSLFVQFRPNKTEKLEALRRHLEMSGEVVYYVENLPSGHTISGTVVRTTKSGVTLKDWYIK